MEIGRRWGSNEAMTAVRAEDGAEPDWEYAPLRIPADVTRPTAAAQLSLHAEFGGWELARVVREVDGTRRVWLRRMRRPSAALPLPRLPV
ncbi:MAG: hypothetical protein QOD31_1703 [Pseudonocardiales bacterium]|nr:hypothetical protein [Pseudonocardiales bacterium]MDT4975803.1 hypothetical protein [Pseudonocardiales bacterium]